MRQFPAIGIYYLVDCRNILTTGACTGLANGGSPVYTDIQPAKTSVLMQTTLTLVGLSISSINTAVMGQLLAGVKASTSLSTATVNNFVPVTGGVAVTFTGTYTTSVTSPVAASLTNSATLLASIQAAGLTSVTSLVCGTPAPVPTTGLDMSSAIPAVPGPSTYTSEPHFKLRIGLGIGLGLGLPITLAVAAFVYSKLPEGGLSITALLQRHAEAGRQTEIDAKAAELTGVATDKMGDAIIAPVEAPSAV